MDNSRHVYIVSYDISDPKRLRKVYETMRGHGAHLQLSVFRCELVAREVVELRARLVRIIHQREDQVLFIDLGPMEGRGAGCIIALGRAYTHPAAPGAGPRPGRRSIIALGRAYTHPERAAIVV